MRCQYFWVYFLGESVFSRVSNKLKLISFSYFKRIFIIHSGFSYYIEFFRAKPTLTRTHTPCEPYIELSEAKLARCQDGGKHK